MEQKEQKEQKEQNVYECIKACNDKYILELEPTGLFKYVISYILAPFYKEKSNFYISNNVLDLFKRERKTDNQIG